MSKAKLREFALGAKLVLLTLLISFNAAANTMRHEFDEGVMYSKLMKGKGYWLLAKEQNDYRYEVYDQAGQLKFKHILPWQPTHQSSANNGTRTLIGYLARNGHPGTGELLMFDDNGLVKSFNRIVDFDLISDTGAFYLIKDKGEQHELVVFNDKLEVVNHKAYPPNFDDHSYLSISPSGDRMSLSAPGPDIASAKTEKVYLGENYTKHMQWDFSGLPIFQVHQLNQGVSIFNVNWRLLAFKGHEKVWDFPEPGRRFGVSMVMPDQSGQYILLQDAMEPGKFVVLNVEGKLLFDSETFNGLEYLKKVDFTFAIKNDDLIIRNVRTNLYDIISLETGKRLKRVWLNDGPVMDLDRHHRLTIVNGKVKRDKM